MLLVLDASVALRVILAAEGFGLLAGHRLVAPSLMLSDVTSALYEGMWRKNVSPELSGIALARLLDPQPELVTDLQPEAWHIAERLGWARTHDAVYVALASRGRCPLLTADGRLARGAGRLVRFLTPVELAEAERG